MPAVNADLNYKLEDKQSDNCAAEPHCRVVMKEAWVAWGVGWVGDIITTTKVAWVKAMLAEIRWVVAWAAAWAVVDMAVTKWVAATWVAAIWVAWVEGMVATKWAVVVWVVVAWETWEAAWVGTTAIPKLRSHQALHW